MNTHSPIKMIRLITKRGTVEYVNPIHVSRVWASGNATYVVMSNGSTLEVHSNLEEVVRRIAPEPTQPEQSNTPWDDFRTKADIEEAKRRTGVEFRQMKPTRY